MSSQVFNAIPVYLHWQAVNIGLWSQFSEHLFNKMCWDLFTMYYKIPMNKQSGLHNTTISLTCLLTKQQWFLRVNCLNILTLSSTREMTWRHQFNDMMSLAKLMVLGDRNFLIPLPLYHPVFTIVIYGW